MGGTGWTQESVQQGNDLTQILAGQEIGLGGQHVRETGRKTPYTEVQRQKGMKKAKMIVWDPVDGMAFQEIEGGGCVWEEHEPNMIQSLAM